MAQIPVILIVSALLTLCAESVHCRSKFNLPNFDADEWKRLDSDLNTRIAPIHHELASDAISPKEAGKHFVDILTEVLQNNPDCINDDSTEYSKFYKKLPSKTLQSVTKLKNKLRKKAYGKNATDEDRKLFRQAVKAHSHLKKIERDKVKQSTSTRQEKLYVRDFWDFAKKCSSGSLDKPSIKPSFTRDIADQYYVNAYSTGHPIDKTKLSWFPYIDVDTGAFDLNPVRPKDVKNVLKRKKPTSAPGNDGIVYGMLRKLPSSHHFMATMFSKLLRTADPPVDWSSSIVTLIHKSGSTDDPKNFRMIALTSCIGKLYHQILAERVEKFAIQNDLINPAMQKAFLRGISGCTENNQVLHELIHDAKARNKTLHVTFFDLQDAFGSIEHDLIHHVLEFYSFPIEIKTYVKNLYSRLDGEIRGPQWSSSKFAFRKVDDIKELITKPDVNQATGKDYDVRYLPGADVRMVTEVKKKRRKRRGEESDDDEEEEKMVDAPAEEDTTEGMAVDAKWNLSKLQNEHGNYPVWMNSRNIKKMQNKNSKGKILKKGKKKQSW